MNTTEKTQPTLDDDAAEMLDEYGHLPFKRAGNRFAKYRNAKAYVIENDGTRYELSEYEQKAVSESAE